VTYHIKDFNEDYLKSKGFAYDYEASNDENIVLSRRSTVWKYNGKPIIEVTIIIYSNKNVRLHVYNCNKTPYSAWYNRCYGKNKIVNSIDCFINREFKKLGIKSNVSKV
jgi:hypothetical protein